MSSRPARIGVTAAFMLGVFAVAVGVQLRLEASGKSDVLGLWYTLYCAAAYTVVVSALAGGVRAIAKRARK